MFIELVRNEKVSSIGAPYARKSRTHAASTEPGRLLFARFYRHGAPTALWIGFRVFAVFQPTVNPGWNGFQAGARDAHRGAVESLECFFRAVSLDGATHSDHMMGEFASLGAFRLGQDVTHGEQVEKGVAMVTFVLSRLDRNSAQGHAGDAAYGLAPHIQQPPVERGFFQSLNEKAPDAQMVNAVTAKRAASIRPICPSRPGSFRKQRSAVRDDGGDEAMSFHGCVGPHAIRPMPLRLGSKTCVPMKLCTGAHARVTITSPSCASSAHAGGVPENCRGSRKPQANEHPR